MKHTNRNLVLAVAALFTGQLLVSCSGTKTQWSKNEVQDETFATNQFYNKKEVEKAPVLKVEERTFTVKNEKENVAIASTNKEIPAQATSKNTDNYSVVKEISQITDEPAKKQSVKETLKAFGAPLGIKASGKNQWLALILCGLVGYLGIHRFYLGYIWQGVVQLLTAGGCGIWMLIDFIRILLGKLQPKDGSYTSGTIDWFN